DSSVGREVLRIEPNVDHGILGRTTKISFIRAFRRLVTDIALGRQSSRTLNSNDNIRAYFSNWEAEDLPRGRGSFIPADVIKGKSVASKPTVPEPLAKKARQPLLTVLPKDLKVRHGTERLIDIRRELVRLKR